jgi:hypothetical protein
MVFRKYGGDDDLEATAIIHYVLANNPLLPQIGILLPALEFYPCIPIEQIEALRALYNALDGDNWVWTNPNKSWKDFHGNWKPLTSSTYEGVEVVDCTIVGIRLAGKGLMGEIPDEIGNLSELIHLDLSNNKIYGGFNPEIASLIKLEHLDLSKNAILGVLPSGMINLTNLSYLNLSYNGFAVWTQGTVGIVCTLCTIQYDRWAWIASGGGIFFDLENQSTQKYDH